jgi:hypothetical protein
MLFSSEIWLELKTLIRDAYYNTVGKDLYPLSHFNYTFLGWVFLGVPLILYLHFMFLIFMVIFIGAMVLFGPFVWISEQEWAKKELFTAEQACKLANKLKLIKRCD